MKKRVVGYSAGLAGLLIMSAALAGCSGKVTAEKVLKKVETVSYTHLTLPTT